MSSYKISKSERRYYNRRNRKGQFIKKTQEQIEYYKEYNNIPEYGYNSATEHYEKLTYRACVTLNGVPEHSERYRGGREHYLNFSYVKVDYYENINIQDLKDKLMNGIAKYFHCNVRDLVYDSDGMEGIGDYWKEYVCLFDIEMPKPYRGSFYEGLEEGHVHIF
jgi:hypothetical protein